MKLRYGNHTHDMNEASLEITKQALFSNNNVQWGTRHRWQITGRLQADTQNELSTKIQQLERAYSRQGLDASLLFDNGSPTKHILESRLTNGGVRVVSPPYFPEGRGAEYSTFRNYAIVLEADVLEVNVLLLEFRESLTFSGGGPEYGFLPVLNGPPIKQLLRQQTTFKAVQSGYSLGLRDYVLPPPPIWPGAEHAHLRVSKPDGYERQGPPGRPTFTNYRYVWNYFFESASPLDARPTQPNQ